MDLPFAVDEEESDHPYSLTTAPTSKINNHDKNLSSSTSSSRPRSNSLLQSAPTYQNVDHVPSSSYVDTSNHGYSNVTSITSDVKSSPSSLQQQQRVALYDNVHPDYYAPKSQAISSSNQTHVILEEEEDFVTIDADQVDPRKHFYTQDKHTSQSLVVSRHTAGHPTDVLALLLSSSIPSENLNSTENTTDIANMCQVASTQVTHAKEQLSQGNINQAFQYFMKSGTDYKEAATSLLQEKENNANVKFLAYSLLCLSHAQIRNAHMLHQSGNVEYNQKADKETRLRNKIRASLNTAEQEMTDSTFLGKAKVSPPRNKVASKQTSTSSTSISTLDQSTPVMSKANPVDDMMDLEQELKDIDATLNMGVNLSASTPSINTKKTVLDGSFCVVPGSDASVGSSSFMSSSMIWNENAAGNHASNLASTPSRVHPQHHHGRVRANRVQNMLGASNAAGIHRSISSGNHAQLQAQASGAGTNPISSTNVGNHSTTNTHRQNNGLESSWWGGASALASSTASLSNSMVGIRHVSAGHGHENHGGISNSSPANTKQLMRLFDSLKTLGDENASLLREVEEARNARMEVKAAHESMRQFKEEYNRKFTVLKAALDKFRSEYPEEKGQGNIVSQSNLVRNKTKTEIQRRDKMIQKLKADLKAEKVESKKKDDALRKYENFYKEVKARSEQKKRQKEEQMRKAAGKN